MRSFVLVVVAGIAIGWLPITALDHSLPQSAVPYNGEALRSAIADGMSRAGGTVVRLESTATDGRR
jgi:hypothetical protein